MLRELAVLTALTGLAGLAPVASANQLVLFPSCTNVLWCTGPNSACSVSFVGELLHRRHCAHVLSVMCTPPIDEPHPSAAV